MKKQGEPLATLMGVTTLVIVGASAKHCMKKYGNGGVGRRSILVRFRKRRLFSLI